MDLFSYLLGKKKGGGGSDLDWSAIGYDSTPKSIIDGYNYAKNIYDNWDSSVTSLSYKFNSDKKLIIMPLVDTSNVQFFNSCFSGSSIIAMPLLDTSNATSMSSMFTSCVLLTTIPLLDTSSVTNMANMFTSCSSLATIPLLDTSSVTGMNNMFQGCQSLTDESVDNILQMCINATAYTGTKTLYQLGFRSSTISSSKIQALPHYQDFIDAGWTIGY